MIKKFGLLGAVILLLLSACAAPTSEKSDTAVADVTHVIDVYKSPTCGCCDDWITYLEENGYRVRVHHVQDLMAVKNEHKVPTHLSSCHTALIDGYVVEGHVPAEEIERLLTERPEVIGIAVAGMPIGSPGMEVEGAEDQPYDVVTFDNQGNTETFASYQQQ